MSPGSRRARPTRRPAPRWLSWLVIAVVAVLVGYGFGLLQPWLVRPPLIVGQDAISGPDTRDVRVQLDDVGGSVISVRPAADAGRALVIIYQGAPVRPQAYEWLARELAVRGFQVVVPQMPFDLAVLDADRAEELIDHYAGGRPVVLAGHSLGGAMAARFAAEHPDRLAGLVLMAAYPPDGVVVRDVPSLVLHAEHDRIADVAEVRAGLAQLPAGTELVVVPGAVHSFFGRYGPQDGDGTPTASRAAAEEFIVDALLAEVDALSP